MKKFVRLGELHRMHRKTSLTMVGMTMLRTMHCLNPTQHIVRCSRAALATVVNSLGHVAHLDDLLARKLEAILASFGHHMCLERSQSLTSTRVTDYSNRKQLVQSWEHVEYSEHKARFFGLLLVMSSKHILITHTLKPLPRGMD